MDIFVCFGFVSLAVELQTNKDPRARGNTRFPLAITLKAFAIYIKLGLFHSQAGGFKMKRAIVLQVRESENKQNNNEKTVWVTVGLLPSKMKSGNLFYPKTTDICVSTCAGILTKPDNYDKFRKLAIGSIVDLSYGVNEFNNKVYVTDISVVCDSPFEAKDLFE